MTGSGNGGRDDRPRLTAGDRPMSEIDAFEFELRRFRRGEISAQEWRSYRLRFGIYTQRQPDVNMVRIKVPGGELTSPQLDGLGALALQFGHGIAHLTTRQDVQLHFVPQDLVPEVMRCVQALGLTTREACGDAVRNITACPLSGVLADEAFEVLPYARAAMRYLIRSPFAQLLPRKFKIAFSGCPEDCVLCGIHDIGLRAVAVASGGMKRAGFSVLVGGGLGTTPYLASTLAEFIPVEELLLTLRAVITVFARFGNRRNRNRARMKFVVEKLGIERFREEVEGVLDGLGMEERREAGLLENVEDRDLALVGSHIWGDLRELGDGPAHGAFARSSGDGATVAPVAPPAAEPPAEPGSFNRWLARNVRTHRDPALAIVSIEVPLGDLEGARLQALSRLAGEYSEGRARTTIQQNLVLPAVRRARLAELYRDLGAIDLRGHRVGAAADIVSCPGTDTCGLGITSSKGLARALRRELFDLAREKGDPLLSEIPIRISGCPNACGQHHVGAIGLHGAAKKVGSRLIPHYQIHLGGESGAGRLALGVPGAKIPARQVPHAVRALIGAYAEAREEGESFAAWVRRAPGDRIDALLAPYLTLRPEDFGPDHDRDWGAGEPFSTDAIQVKKPVVLFSSEGTDPFSGCGADLVRAAGMADRRQSADAAALLHRTLLRIARVLLEPLGLEPDSDREVLCELRAQVIDRGRITDRFESALERTQALLGRRRPYASEVRARLAETWPVLEEARRTYPSLASLKEAGEPVA